MVLFTKQDKLSYLIEKDFRLIPIINRFDIKLGFKEDSILPKAQKILSENDIQKPEQLVHLVLKEV